MTDWGELLCPRCGVWINVDGDELGPTITEEQAKANYEQYVIDTAAKMVEEAKELKEDPKNFATVTITKRHGTTAYTNTCASCGKRDLVATFHVDGVTYCPSCSGSDSK